ncbi:MAG: Hpt domain-containing protein [Planctomycetota bacterium]
MTESGCKHGILVSELATDPDMAELIEMFVDELPDRVGAIEQTLTEQDFDTLKSLAHQLKGAAGGYGFPTITDAAKAIEATAKTTKDIEKLTKEVEFLTTLCRCARATPPRE